MRTAARMRHRSPDAGPRVRSNSRRYAAKLVLDLIETAAKLCKRRIRMHFDYLPGVIGCAADILQLGFRPIANAAHLVQSPLKGKPSFAGSTFRQGSQVVQTLGKRFQLRGRSEFVAISSTVCHSVP
jgi:hypothetical protein